jgi:hypothetical protein
MTTGDTQVAAALRVAVIGSFRKHNYDGVVRVIELLRNAGFEVTSPAGSGIVSGDEFVRFETDAAQLSDPEVQSHTLERIFSADVAYVVVPGGHIGRTTAYEVGRIVQRRQPVYFSMRPDDLPIAIPDAQVLAVEDFVAAFSSGARPVWLFDDGDGALFEAERRLVRSA